MSEKTNALRLLDQHKIAYTTLTYGVEDGLTDGGSVAIKIGKNPEEVFKTLVTQGASGAYYVYVLAVNQELDLKKAAKVAHEKHIEMIHVKDIVKITGYQKGGCSPIGMKKQFTTFLDEDALLFEKIICSAGKIGLQMVIDPQAIEMMISIQTVDLKKE